MQTVAVYQYRGFSISLGKTINHGTYATLEFISRHQELEAVLESKKEVSPSLLGEDGKYIDSEEQP